MGHSSARHLLPHIPRLASLLVLIATAAGGLTAPPAGASTAGHTPLSRPPVAAAFPRLTAPPGLSSPVSHLWRLQDLRPPALRLPRSPALLPDAPGSGWRVQRSPNPASGYGVPVAISCPGPSYCIAVGSSETRFGRIVSLAETWNGKRWSLRPVPLPARATGSELYGVSCISPGSCTAVGYYTNRAGQALSLAETWNGRRWVIQDTPSPAGNTGSGLSGVSCLSASLCTAVGEYDDSAGYTRTLAERWNGQSWSLQHGRAPAGAVRSALSGVSCVSAATCTAVGSYESGSGATVALAEGWNGHRWAVQPLPRHAGSSGSGLQAVSCTSATACTAVGQYQAKKTSQPLADRWNGRAWRIQQVTEPPGSTAGLLEGVWCSGAKACTATGAYAGIAGGSLALAEAWNGTGWAVQKTPGPAGALASALTSVSCPSRHACMAGGIYADAAGSTVPLAERWTGTRWRPAEPPAPSGALSSQLGATSCPSPRTCFAVGAAQDDLGIVVTLAERWNGTRWSIQPTPNPAGASTSEFTNVSCTSADACTAVGYDIKGATYHTLAERWNGTQWILQPTPVPPGTTSSGLNGVSCASPRACTAVGIYILLGGRLLALAEAWNGSRWTIQPTPDPARFSEIALAGVSCPSASDCTAVGNSVTYSGKSMVLAEAWDGSSWHIQPAPAPAKNTGSSFSAVSCTSASACTAAGGYGVGMVNTSRTLAERWNGARWVIQPTPNPGAAGISGTQLMGVSCASRGGGCAAVGYYISFGNEPVAVAEQWNGSRWSLRHVQTPAGAVQTVLFGAACTRPACAAVGYYVPDSGIAVTLVESASNTAGG